MPRTLAAAAVAAAISAGAVALPTFAQNGGGTNTNTTTTTTKKNSSTRADERAQHQARETEYRTALAKALGVSVEKLTSAQQEAGQTVFLAHLDEMVSAGRISAADAKALKDAAANGTFAETLKAQHLAQLKSRLAADVKAGRMTQAQADQILKDATSQSATDDGFGMGPGFGPGGSGGPGGPGDHDGRGHHGGPGMGGGFPTP